MHNIQELERQWLRYKIKSYLPKIALILFLPLILIGLIWHIYSLSTSTDDVKEKTKKLSLSSQSTTIQPVQHKPIEKPSVNEKEKTPINVVKKETALAQKQTSPSKQVMLSPSLTFIDTIKAEKVTPKPISNLPVSSNIGLKKREPQTQIVEHQEIKQEDIQVQQVVAKDQVIKKEPKQTHTISIDTRQEEEDIEDVLKRFKRNKKPALSLFAAKRYYAIGKYRDAYNYALITNEVNSKIEESWLIAAKSLVKLGETENALRLLSQFIDKSRSVRAKILLDQIKNGTME